MKHYAKHTVSTVVRSAIVTIGRTKRTPAIIALVFLLSVAATLLSLFNSARQYIDRHQDDLQPRVGALGLIARGQTPATVAEPLRLQKNKLTIIHVGIPAKIVEESGGASAYCLKLPFVADSGSAKITKDVRLSFGILPSRFVTYQTDVDNNVSVFDRSDFCNFERFSVDQRFSDSEVMTRHIRRREEGVVDLNYRFRELFPDKIAMLHFYVPASPNMWTTEENGKPLRPDQTNEILVRRERANFNYSPSVMRVSAQRMGAESDLGFIMLVVYPIRVDADLLTAGSLFSDHYVDIARKNYGIDDIDVIEQIFWLPTTLNIQMTDMINIFNKEDQNNGSSSGIAAAEMSGKKSFFLLMNGEFSFGCYKGRLGLHSNVTAEKKNDNIWTLKMPFGMYTDLRNQIRANLIFSRQFPSLFDRVANGYYQTFVPSPTTRTQDAIVGGAKQLLAVWNGCQQEKPIPGWIKLGP